MLLALAEKTEAPVTLQKHVYFCVNCSKYPSSSINLYVYLSLSLFNDGAPVLLYRCDWMAIQKWEENSFCYVILEEV